MCTICLLNIWPLTVTLNLSWHMGNMGSAHPLVEVNLSFKFEENLSISKGILEWIDIMGTICLLNIWPLTVTLTLSWHMGNMGSAHPLVEVNVSFKF